MTSDSITGHQRKLRSRTLYTLAAFLFLQITTTAQEITGTIFGTISDPDGAVIPRARIEIEDSDKTTVVRSLVTDSVGNYTAPRLPVGRYNVTAEAIGFDKVQEISVPLSVGEKRLVNITLPLRATQQEITVTDDPLQVRLNSAAQETLISGSQLRELSLNNRNAAQLVTLLPGVSPGIPDQLYIGTTNPNTGQLNAANFAINGARSSENNWTVDGADNLDRGSSQRLLTYPSVDAISEFKVLGGVFDAEYGKASGGFVNVVTRSGTNTFHGSAYEFFRNDVLSANNYFNNRFGIERPPFRYNNFGWTLGGPIPIFRHSGQRTFFFFSQEFRRVVASNTIASTAPTAAEKSGIFQHPVCVSFSGGTCLATGTQITAINPVAAAYITDIWSKIPEPQDPVSHQLFSVQQSIANHRQELARVDHVFGPRLSIFARYLHDSIPTQEPGGVFGTTPLPLVATTETNSPGQSWVVRATWVAAPTRLIEVGYSYSYGAVFSEPIGLVAAENSPDIRIPLPFPAELPRVPRLTFGNVLSNVTGFGPYRQSNRNHAVFGTATYVRGPHTIKVGATYNRYKKRENAGNLNAGSFRFSSGGQPAGSTQLDQTWANFLLGNAASFTQTSVDAQPELHANQFELFAQDEFRISRSLTLNMGLRASFFRQPVESTNQITNFDTARFNPANAPAIDPKGNIVPGPGDPLNGIIAAGTSSPFGDKISNENNSNFAPRIGIAWDPFGDGKTALRAGYGIFFDSNIFGIYQDSAFLNPPFVQNVVISNTRLENPGAGTTAMTPPALRGTPLPNHTPYTQEWVLDVQRELDENLVATFGYIGTKGTHLLGAININQPLPGQYVSALPALAGNFITADTTPLLNSIRPFPGYGAINVISSSFNSNYNSLQASLRKQFRSGSFIGVGYTYSKALTDNPTDRSSAPQNAYDIRAEYGPSQLDRRHVLTANFVYALPWLRNEEGMLGHAFGDWELSGILTFDSGLPLTVSATKFDPAGLAILDPNSLAASRPDAIGDPNVNAPHSVDAWFNTSVFSEVPAGQYRPGNARRGTVRGPGYYRIDLSLLKNFRFTERFRLQFRAESFNVFNHTNFDGVNTTFGASGFGKITSTRDPRIVQLALKFLF